MATNTGALPKSPYRPQYDKTGKPVPSALKIIVKRDPTERDVETPYWWEIELHIDGHVDGLGSRNAFGTIREALEDATECQRKILGY